VDLEKDAKGLLDREENRRVYTDGDRTSKRSFIAEQRAAKQKMMFFGQVMRANVMEKDMMLACGEGREADQGRSGWRKYTRCQG